jgi:2-(1,2-epoxy-1,2-dihydrophenyl)acetyl-CoA isomerase
VLNSFTRDMAAELRNALEAAAVDQGVRALLITGAGRAFCAGQDLADVPPLGGDTPPDLGTIVARDYNPIIRGLRALEKPVVCAVNGVAAGAGANLAFACDIVLASEGASFIQSFCKIGLIPDSGGTYFLPRLVGLPRAAAMMLLGDKVSAGQALEWGMIYRVCPADSLMQDAIALASTLATQPTRGLGLIKRALRKSFTSSLDEQLEVEMELQREAGRTADYAEGVRAFLDKRPPRFVGR